MKNWYYKKDEKTFGPFSLDELRNLIEDGTITGDTFIWEAYGDKQKASEAVFFHFKSVPELPRSKVRAVTSMILGLISCSLVCMGPLWGLAALYTGVKALWLIVRRKEAGFIYAVAGILLAFLCFAEIFLVIDYDKKPTRYKPTDKCEACTRNMVEIGFALKNYAVDNDGNYPSADGGAGLEELSDHGYLAYLPTGVFQCPGTALEKQENDLAVRYKNISYVYKGGAKNIPENADMPVLWDNDGNHKDFGNILYADGRVETVQGKDWKDKLKLHDKAGTKK